MMISTKGRYALRFMIDLALHDNGDYTSLGTISERQEISLKYLEMIASILNRAGFITSLRGKGGGYMLARKPADYTLGSILKLTEGSLAPVSCLDNSSNACNRADHCITLPLWIKLDKLIDDYLEGITLEDLIKNNSALSGNDYAI